MGFDRPRTSQPFQYPKDHCSLHWITPSLVNLRKLETLIASDNHIYTLPPVVGLLTSLIRLELASNQLSDVSSIVSLVHLKKLDLSNTMVEALPPSIGTAMPNLTELYCDENALHTLPESLSNTKLTLLSAMACNLTAVPEFVQKLSTLQTLKLSFNRISVVPDWIGSLSSLTYLSLSAVGLSTVPLSIQQLSVLKELDLSNNLITTLPSAVGNLKSLRILSLKSNSITALPNSFINLNDLNLDVSFNQLVALPRDIGKVNVSMFAQTLALTATALFSISRFSSLAGNFLNCNDLKITGEHSKRIEDSCKKTLQKSCEGMEFGACVKYIMVCTWQRLKDVCVAGTYCELFGANTKCLKCRAGFGIANSGACEDCNTRHGMWSNGTTQCLYCLVDYCGACSATTGECTSCNSIRGPNGKCLSPSAANTIMAFATLTVLAVCGVVITVVIRRRFRRIMMNAEAAALLVPEDSPQRILVGLDRHECLDGAGLGVVVSPSSLKFGSDKRPLAINSPVIDTLAIFGVNKRSSFQIVLPDACPERFDIVASSLNGTATRSNRTTVDITLTLRCTTKVNLKAFVIVDKKRFAEFSINAESVLSSKFDASELEIGAVLGTGGFGTVYRGSWRGTQVAIKSYNESAVNDEAMRADIEREVEMCTALRHSNVVSFFGSAQAPGKYLIIMELVECGALDSAVRKGPLDPKFKVRVLLDITRGMDFLHQNHIIHRDLKTANVLVASFDPSAQVCGKLSDFNTSRFIGANSCTKTKGIGTPVFMAPEIINIDRHYTGAVDVYSFGVLAWNVWTQKEPFADFADQFAIIKFVLEGQRLPIPDDVPSELKQVIAASWAADPNQRPPFQQLIRAISSIVP